MKEINYKHSFIFQAARGADNKEEHISVCNRVHRKVWYLEMLANISFPKQETAMYMGLKGKHIVITALTNVKDKIVNVYDTNCKVKSYIADITERGEMEQIAGDLLKKYEHIDVLINNVANNPKVEGDATNMKAI